MRFALTALAATAILAVAFTTTARAQQDPALDPTPVTKPKPGTTAYCNSLKSTSAKTSCLKKVNAQAKAGPPATPKTPAATKKTTTKPAPKPDTTAAAPPSNTSMPPPPASTVVVPPLPQKTI
jgi:hypothetical protein